VIFVTKETEFQEEQPGYCMVLISFGLTHCLASWNMLYSSVVSRHWTTQVKVQVKVKFTLEQAAKFQRGS